MTGDRVPSGRKLCGHSAGAIPDRRPLAPNQTGICHFDGGCCVGPDLLPVNPRTPLWSCCLVIADAFESVPPTGSLDCIPPGDLTAAPSPTIMVSLGPVWLPANPGVPGLELPPVPGAVCWLAAHSRRAVEAWHHRLAGYSVALYADGAWRSSITEMGDIRTEPCRRDCPQPEFRRAQLG
jgi:hypothetical protein